MLRKFTKSVIRLGSCPDLFQTTKIWVSFLQRLIAGSLFKNFLKDENLPKIILVLFLTVLRVTLKIVSCLVKYCFFSYFASSVLFASVWNYLNIFIYKFVITCVFFAFSSGVTVFKRHVVWFAYIFVTCVAHMTLKFHTLIPFPWFQSILWVICVTPF